MTKERVTGIQYTGTGRDLRLRHQGEVESTSLVHDRRPDPGMGHRLPVLDSWLALRAGHRLPCWIDVSRVCDFERHPRTFFSLHERPYSSVCRLHCRGISLPLALGRIQGRGFISGVGRRSGGMGVDLHGPGLGGSTSARSRCRSTSKLVPEAMSSVRAGSLHFDGCTHEQPRSVASSGTPAYSEPR